MNKQKSSKKTSKSMEFNGGTSRLGPQSGLEKYGQSTKEPEITSADLLNGTYMNALFIRAFFKIYGCEVEITVRNGAVYHGVLYSLSPKGDILLQCVHRVRGPNEDPSSNINNPSKKQLEDFLAFSCDDIVQMIACEDVDLDQTPTSATVNGSTFITDSELGASISAANASHRDDSELSRLSNGTGVERELTPWCPIDADDNANDLASLDETPDNCNGWSPEDMIKTNRENCGVENCEYDESKYTSVLDKSSDDYQSKIGWATEQAKKIQECSEHSNRLLMETNISGQRDEEEMFSAVARGTGVPGYQSNTPPLSEGQPSQLNSSPSSSSRDFTPVYNKRANRAVPGTGSGGKGAAVPMSYSPNVQPAANMPFMPPTARGSYRHKHPNNQPGAPAKIPGGGGAGVATCDVKPRKFVSAAQQKMMASSLSSANGFPSEISPQQQQQQQGFVPSDQGGSSLSSNTEQSSASAPTYSNAISREPSSRTMKEQIKAQNFQQFSKNFQLVQPSTTLPQPQKAAQGNTPIASPSKVSPSQLNAWEKPPVISNGKPEETAVSASTAPLVQSSAANKESESEKEQGAVSPTTNTEKLEPVASETPASSDSKAEPTTDIVKFSKLNAKAQEFKPSGTFFPPATSASQEPTDDQQMSTGLNSSAAQVAVAGNAPFQQQQQQSVTPMEPMMAAAMHSLPMSDDAAAAAALNAQFSFFHLPPHAPPPATQYFPAHMSMFPQQGAQMPVTFQALGPNVGAAGSSTAQLSAGVPANVLAPRHLQQQQQQYQNQQFQNHPMNSSSPNFQGGKGNRPRAPFRGATSMAAAPYFTPNSASNSMSHPVYSSAMGNPQQQQQQQQVVTPSVAPQQMQYHSLIVASNGGPAVAGNSNSQASMAGSNGLLQSNVGQTNPGFYPPANIMGAAHGLYAAQGLAGGVSAAGHTLLPTFSAPGVPSSQAAQIQMHNNAHNHPASGNYFPSTVPHNGGIYNHFYPQQVRMALSHGPNTVDGSPNTQSSIPFLGQAIAATGHPQGPNANGNGQPPPHNVFQTPQGPHPGTAHHQIPLPTAALIASQQSGTPQQNSTPYQHHQHSQQDMYAVSYPPLPPPSFSNSSLPNNSETSSRATPQLRRTPVTGSVYSSPGGDGAAVIAATGTSSMSESSARADSRRRSSMVAIASTKDATDLYLSPELPPNGVNGSTPNSQQQGGNINAHLMHQQMAAAVHNNQRTPNLMGGTPGGPQFQSPMFLVPNSYPMVQTMHRNPNGAGAPPQHQVVNHQQSTPVQESTGGSNKK